MFGGLHHRKQVLHLAVECDPLALDQMLLRPEYHEASVLCTTHCSALHGPSDCLQEGGGQKDRVQITAGKSTAGGDRKKGATWSQQRRKRHNINTVQPVRWL